MMSLKALVFVLVLAQLGVLVESGSGSEYVSGSGSESGSGSGSGFEYGSGSGPGPGSGSGSGSWSGSGSGSWSAKSRDRRVKESKLMKLFGAKIDRADWVRQPLDGLYHVMGDISHSGVRVTLKNGMQWLIHKGSKWGKDSDTVVDYVDNTDSSWTTFQKKKFGGRKTVLDFLRAGGKYYNLFTANCHHAAKAMMSL